MQSERALNPLNTSRSRNIICRCNTNSIHVSAVHSTQAGRSMAVHSTMRTGHCVQCVYSKQCMSVEAKGSADVVESCTMCQHSRDRWQCLAWPTHIVSVYRHTLCVAKHLLLPLLQACQGPVILLPRKLYDWLADDWRCCQFTQDMCCTGHAKDGWGCAQHRYGPDTEVGHNLQWTARNHTTRANMLRTSG